MQREDLLCEIDQEEMTNEVRLIKKVRSVGECSAHGGLSDLLYMLSSRSSRYKVPHSYRMSALYTTYSIGNFIRKMALINILVNHTNIYISENHELNVRFDSQEIY